MSVVKGSWSARYPNLMNIPRGSGKSVLVGMDFSSLEDRTAAAIAIRDGNSARVVSVSSEGRIKDDAIDALLMQALQHGLSGMKADWYTIDDVYLPPKPHCMSQVHDIIDSFWSAPALGLYGQYIAQLDKKPKTKDVFKGKSTTHHYPWYRRGSKY